MKNSMVTKERESNRLNYPITVKLTKTTADIDHEIITYLFIYLSEESATISYRLGMGMIPDEEDSRDFESTNDSSLQPVTDLMGVADGPSNEAEQMPSQTTTDISSMLEQDSNQEVGKLKQLQ